MALSYSIKGRGAFGDMNAKVVDITFDNSYPTGGWLLDGKSLGLGLNGTPLFVDLSGGKAGYILEYDHVNQKIKAYQNAAGAGALTELVNASAVLNAVVVRAFVLGKGSPG